MDAQSKKPSLPVSLLLLFAAVAIYAIAGSPTPDNPGWIEGLIGCLLILAIGAAGISQTTDLLRTRSFFFKSLQIFFLCGLIIPLLSGVYHANDWMLIARDLAAFAFLGLPLFLTGHFEGQEKGQNFFLWLLVIAGILFCVRTLLPIFNIWIPQGELLYLSNSPLALFAGVFLVTGIWKNFLYHSRAGFFKAVLMLSGLALITAAMLLDVQRATVGAIILSIAVMIFFDFVKSPKRTILPILIILLITACAYPLIDDALSAITRKTAEVGLNMRVQEARAVYDAVSPDAITIFAGQGWGSVFQSPAVGGLEVNYTHSLLTTLALKGGIILLLLGSLVVLAALYEIFLIFQRDKGMGLSLFWPLVIPVFLYASHKSLDFGLLLLLIGVWSDRGAALHRADPSCKKKEHL